MVLAMRRNAPCFDSITPYRLRLKTLSLRYFNVMATNRPLLALAPVAI